MEKRSVKKRQLAVGNRQWHNSRFYCLLSIAYCLLFFSCDRADRIAASVEYEPQLVVEGWIESGGVATVLLTQSAPLLSLMDTAFLLRHVIRSAKVSVSNGDTTEILSLRTDSRYLPPYTYVSSYVRGEVGKSYTLTVESRGRVITAQTHIPQPVPLTDWLFTKRSPTDTLGYLNISFRNSSSLFYQVATRVHGKESIFTPCLYGSFSAAQHPADSLVDMQLSKGPILYPLPQFNPCFVANDTVHLKFKTMPQHGYDFWTSWQNELINGQNPIFPANTSLHSNINGGIGIWCGYGTYTYVMVMQ